MGEKILHYAQSVGCPVLFINELGITLDSFLFHHLSYPISYI